MKKSSSSGFYEAGLLANLTGRYLAQRMINEKRVRFFKETSSSIPLLELKGSCFDDLEIPSAFDEALAFFLNKGVIDKPQFRKLSAEMRRQSFTLVADMREHVLQRVKEMLSGFLASGRTVQEFSNDLFGYFNQAGVTLKNPYYYDLVFQNNIQEALARGKDAIYEDADQEEFPSRQLLTVGDDRVRLPHGLIHGFTAPVNDPIWFRLKTPLGHGCRCSVTLVHKDEAVSNWNPASYPSLTGPGFEFVN